MALSTCPRCGLEFEPIVPGMDHNGIHRERSISEVVEEWVRQNPDRGRHFVEKPRDR